MAESHKYYYLKLKEGYFDQDAIVLLESMPDGILYSNLLLKLYLKSLKHEGRLLVDDHIPLNPQMIATITRFQVGTVERALNVLRRLGLVELLEDGALYLPNIELMVGRSSTEAERKRRAMLAARRRLAPAQAAAEKIPPEIEIDSETETKTESESELESEGREKTDRQAYGHHQNVWLNHRELADLQREFPDRWADYVEKLSAYMVSTGRAYRNHAATLRLWLMGDTKGSRPVARPRSYDTEEGETI